MFQINDDSLRRRLIDAHGFQDIFSMDLEQCTTLVRYTAGEHICHAGERVSFMLLLAEGECIASSITQTGKFHCELQYHSPNILGLTASLWNKPAINNIDTLTDCLFLSISMDQCGEALRQDVKFLNYACLYLADHIRANSMHSEPLPTRLAHFILREQKNGYFTYSINVCADILETSQRHLLRTLRSFCDDGILEHTGRSNYKILDPDRLTSQ